MARAPRSLLVLAFACGGALALPQCGLTERNPRVAPDEPATLTDAGSTEADAGEPELDASVPEPDAAAPLDAGLPLPPLDAAVEPKPTCPDPPAPPTQPVSEHRFQVQWDYRDDSHGFLLGETQRALLTEAARIWGEVVRSDFAAIPSGTEILMRNPERPDEAGEVFKIEYEIDDLLLFVASSRRDGPGGAVVGVRNIAALGSVTNLALQSSLRLRYEGPQFQPWTGWMTFDADESWFFDATPESDDDLPPDQVDFLSVAVGSLGGALGFGGSAAFQKLLDDDGSFVGCGAMALYGGPVPLNDNHTRIQRDVLSDGREPVMNGRYRAGVRNIRPTSLDLAMLADIGYQVVRE